MKKVLICLLLLVHLFTGLAFALDTHPEAVVGHESGASDLLAGIADCDDDLHQGDHCGHAAAHLVGLIFEQTTSVMISNDHDFFIRPQNPNLLYIAPLLRPPIV